MANFMGPMAPPQAAPSAPPQLDIRTNPTQRAQFKSFMQDMSRPAAPPTTAPIAPMLPAPMPSPMDQIDIFAPAPMASGGIVGGFNRLSKMSDEMVDAVNEIVYGGDPGGGGFGGGIGGPMSSGGGFGGGQMPAPLPPITAAPFTPTPPNPSGPTFGTMPHHFSGGSGPVIDTFALPDNYVGNPAPNIPAPNFEDRILSLNDSALLGMPTPSYMPMDPDGDGMDQQGRPMESQLTDAERMQAEQDQQDRITSLRSTLNNQGSAFGSGSMGNPLARLGGIGAGLGSIFGYKDGGAVDPYAMEGKIGQSVGPKMVGGTTNVIDASGSNTGGGSSDPISSMDLYDVAMANPPLPITGTPALISALDASMSMHNQRTDREDAKRAAMGNALRASAPMAKMRDFASNILSATQMDGPMGSTFGVRPVARDGNLGIMANFSLPFEDGGPVGMRRGGVTFKSGERFESGRGIAEQQRERAERAAAREEDPGEEAGIDRGFPDSSERPVTKDDPITQAEVNAAFGASENQRPTGAITLKRSPPPTGDMSSVELFDTLDTATQAAVMNPPPDSMIAPVAPIAAPTMDVIDPMTDLLAGEPGTSGAGDDSLSAALNRLYSTPITNMRGGEKRSAAEDLLIRTGRADMPTDSGGGFPSLAKIAVDALTGIGKGRAGKVADNIEMGRPAVIDARSGQITGYVGEGLFGIGNSYTGRPGYDPFGPNATFDPSRNAYIVQPDISTGDSDERASGQTPATPPPATDSADTTPPPLMIGPPTTGLPPSGPSPTDVLVPSTRTNVPVTVPSLLPSEGLAPTLIPQSFLDLLASFNRPAPVAMQDGGAVLDKAADDFLEALKVA